MEGIPRETLGGPGPEIDPNCSFFDEGGGRSDLLQEQTRETRGKPSEAWDDGDIEIVGRGATPPPSCRWFSRASRGAPLGTWGRIGLAPACGVINDQAPVKEWGHIIQPNTAFSDDGCIVHFPISSGPQQP